MHRSPALLVLALATCTLSAADPTEREAWLWPFASTSIFNTPIGSNASYVSANLTSSNSTHHGIDHEGHYRLSSSDPVRQVYPPSSWNTRWPGDTAFPYRFGPHWSMPVPDSLIIADAVRGYTPNEACSFLMPDGRELRQLEPACRVVAAADIVGWPIEPIDIYGNDNRGTHWGSALSTLGGSIRLGELTGTAPLRHAIKWNLWGRHLFYNHSTNNGFRWPATTQDNYAADGYQGTLPALTMGSLLALRPNVTAASLGVTTSVGAKLVDAVRDYGAYIVDDSGWDAYDLCCEKGVEAEVQAIGLQLGGSSGPLVADLRRIVAALAVVDNNTESNVGGGGTPRRPLAPPLADPLNPVPTGLNTAGPAGAVVVQWGDPSSTETGFELHRRPTGGAWTSIAAVAANVNTWTDTTATAGGWEYRIRLLKTPNASAWSTTVALTVGGGSSGQSEIAVSRSAALADGGTDALASSTAGTLVTLTYTVANTGTAALTLGSVAVTGTSNASATVTTAPGANVAAASSTTLVISVTPTASGAWSVPVSFATNDSDENPTNWIISGTAVAIGVNRAPLVDAGLPLLITLPATASLLGTINDDGLPGSLITVQWSMVSGPTTVSFSAPTSLATTATFSHAGTYVLRLTANDGLLSGSGDLTVQVNEASSVNPTVSTSSPIAPTTSPGQNCGAGIGSLLIGIAWALSFLRRQKT